MHADNISPADMESILRAAIQPLVQELAAVRAELAALKGELQIKESAAQRRARLEREAIFMLPDHHGSLSAIARALDVPTSTLNSWPKFKRSRAEYMALMQADGRDRFAPHFEDLQE